MQLIRPPKAINIAERVLPELVADWMKTNSVQNIDIRFVQKLEVNMLILWVIKRSKRWMPHQCTFWNVTHRAWAICDLNNHDLFWKIPVPGSQKRLALSLESISTIPVQASASDVKIPKWGQHCSNRSMPCHLIIFSTVRKTGDQPNKDPGGLLRSTVVILSKITNREIQRPGMLVAQNISQVSLVRCTNDWHNRHSSREQILRIPPPITFGHLAGYSVTFLVYKAHRFKIEARLKWEMCQKELYTLGNIPVV